MDHGNDPLGELFEKGQNIAGSQIKKIVTTTQQQLTNSQSAGGTDTSKTANAADASQTAAGQALEQSSPAKQTSASTSPQQSPSNPLQQIIGAHPRTPEEEAKIKQAQEKLKLEMHKSGYFDPTFNRPKPKEEPVAEKIEREEQEDLWKKQQEEAEKRKADEPLALSRAKRTTEINRGASG